MHVGDRFTNLYACKYNNDISKHIGGCNRSRPFQLRSITSSLKIALFVSAGARGSRHRRESNYVMHGFSRPDLHTRTRAPTHTYMYNLLGLSDFKVGPIYNGREEAVQDHHPTLTILRQCFTTERLNLSK